MCVEWRGGGGVMAALYNFHFILFKFKCKEEDCQYESESSVNVLFYFTYVEAYAVNSHHSPRYNFLGLAWNIFKKILESVVRA